MVHELYPSYVASMRPIHDAFESTLCQLGPEDPTDRFETVGCRALV